jgi:hypothetical protein
MDSQRDPEREAPAGQDPPADHALFQRLVQDSTALKKGLLRAVRWHAGCGLSEDAFERIAATEGFKKIWSGAWVKR